MFLIVKYYEGVFDIDDLFRSLKETSMHNDFSSKYNVLNDLRECELSIEVEDVIGFVESIKNDNHLYDKRNIVFLTSSPNHVIFGELLNIFKNEHDITLLTCSTLEKALYHLQIDINDKAYIEKILFDLKFGN